MSIDNVVCSQTATHVSRDLIVTALFSAQLCLWLCLALQKQCCLSLKKKHLYLSPLRGEVGSHGKMSNIKHEMFRRPVCHFPKRSIPGRKENCFFRDVVAAGAWNGSLANGVVCDPSSQLEYFRGPEFFYGNFLEVSLVESPSLMAGLDCLSPDDAVFCFAVGLQSIQSLMIKRAIQNLFICPKFKSVY